MWVPNLVPVRKKSGQICLCVDFQNLNHTSENDNYLVTSMEEIMQKLSGSEMFSLLDRYSEYNQVLVVDPDKQNFI